MALRTISVLIAFWVTSMFGQLPAPVKAGDRAPNLTWTKIIASDAGIAGPQNLVGNTTVLMFLRPVSHNKDAVAAWNKLIEQFSGEPVNFVWIANEKEDSLAPFLKDHAIRGWMVLDSEEASYKAYGVEGADIVFINRDGIIAGFVLAHPQADQVRAVMNGRAIAIDGEPTEAQLDAFFEAKAVRLEATPFRSPAPPAKPDIPPSDEVHISISKTNGTISSTGPDHWMHRGFDLKATLAMVTRTSPTQIELPPELDNGTRYDFIFVPPGEEDDETISRHVQAGIEKHFHITITREIRTMNVFVMSALAGKTPAPKSAEEESFMGGMTFATDWQRLELPEGKQRTRKAIEEATRRAMDTEEFRRGMAMAQLTGMTALSSSIDEFRAALEDGLRRPVIDETGLSGTYDFETQGSARTTEEFLNMVRDQLGLLLTPTQRNIEVTVVRPASN